MISVILVDDMRPALRELEFLFKQYQDITIEGMYTDPLSAIEKIGEMKPQAVFLDINMPQLQGMDAASRILDLSPETDIVFVTAYDQYAVEAFELHAMDYLLKPITKERLERTVERLRRKTPAAGGAPSSNLKIRCFGRFWMGWEGRDPIKWRTEKARELFTFLLQNHDRNVSRDELLDTLWPEDDPDRTVKQLYNGIYHIRKALEAYGIGNSLIRIDNDYHLQLGRVDWDVRRFYQLCENNTADRLDTLEEMIKLYKDDYLHGEYFLWADLERERLSRLHEQSVIELSKNYLQVKKYDLAESILLKAYHRNPFVEDISELLLMLYNETGKKSSAIRHFNAYSSLIKEELGIQPDKRLQELVKR